MAVAAAAAASLVGFWRSSGLVDDLVFGVAVDACDGFEVGCGDEVAEPDN